MNTSRIISDKLGLKVSIDMDDEVVTVDGVDIGIAVSKYRHIVQFVEDIDVDTLDELHNEEVDEDTILGVEDLIEYVKENYLLVSAGFKGN